LGSEREEMWKFLGYARVIMKKCEFAGIVAWGVSSCDAEKKACLVWESFYREMLKGFHGNYQHKPTFHFKLHVVASILSKATTPII
jgi:hypothetical protein